MQLQITPSIGVVVNFTLSFHEFDSRKTIFYSLSRCSPTVEEVLKFIPRDCVSKHPKNKQINAVTSEVAKNSSSENVIRQNLKELFDLKEKKPEKFWIKFKYN